MKYKIIVSTNISPHPGSYELTAAIILASYFKSDAHFIERTTSKTADVMIKNIAWEIKSPMGKGKRNIQHQFSRAMKQSCNIVFDARRSKIHMIKITRELEKQFKMTKSIKRLVLITKTSKVVEFKR